MKFLRYFRSGLAIFLLVTVAACQSVQTTSEGATGVDRKQFMLMSSEDVNDMASQQYRQTLQADRQKGRLNTAPQAVERVNRVAKNLIKQTATFRPDAPGWKWEINVETNNQINAYCAPGGKIMVFTGLLDQLHLTDDELAAVIGHEMAHALREHGREQMSEVRAEQLGIGLLGVITGMNEDEQKLAGNIASVALTLPHSREHEREADIIGLELAARAGYNPNSAIELWQKMERAGGNSGPAFLSTHPSDEDRISELQKQIPKVMPLYQAAKHN